MTEILEGTEIKRVGEDAIQITIDEHKFVKLNEFFEKMNQISCCRINEIQSTIHDALSDKIKERSDLADSYLTALGFSNDTILVIGQNSEFIGEFNMELSSASRELKL